MPPAVIDLSPDENAAADRTYGTSRWWRRRYVPTALLLGGYWIVLIWLAAGGIGVPLPLAGILAIVSLAGAYRRHTRRTLSIGRGGVSYSEAPWLALQSAWANVERIVLLGKRPTSIALLLRESGRTGQTRRRPFGWLTSTPYPLERTIPLEPFFDAIRGPEIQTRLLFLAPELFGPPPTRLERPPRRRRARLLGLAIILLPLVVAFGAVVYAQLDNDLTTATRLDIGFAFIVSLVVSPLLLIRNLGLTGERLFDAVGRIVLRPARGESRVGVFAPIVVLYVMVLAFSLVGGARLGSIVSGPSCNAAAFSSQAPALSEPQWPGHPTSTITIPLGIGWNVVPLTEASVAQMLSGGSAAFAASYTKTIRGYIRNGLVTLAVQEWPGGGVTTLYVYELVCPNVPLNGDLAFPADQPALGGPTGVTGVVRGRTYFGGHATVYSGYHEVENGAPVKFDIYEWTEADTLHFFRLIARTDGAGEPTASIEEALRALRNAT
jgi:hypothetical protein